MKKLILSMVLAACSGVASGQTLDWLPISDIPLSNGEVNQNGPGPGLSAMCAWDPDGDGPLPQRLVVTGSMNLTIPDANHLAYLDESGWHGLSYEYFNTTTFSITTYRPPGATHDELYIGRIPLLRHNGTAFSEIGGLSGGRTYAMTVGDLDGAGPEPSKLFIINSVRTYSWDGTNMVWLTGGPERGLTRTGIVCDVDGAGPLPPRLIVAGENSTFSALFQWTGTEWSNWTNVYPLTSATSNDVVYRLDTVDFDGNGPGAPELVAAGSFGKIGSDTNVTGPLAVYRNGAWVGLCDPFASGYIADVKSYDPDGDGPLTTRVVIGGSFSSISGVTASKLAYLEDGAWHPFPAYWGGGVVSSLMISSDAPYSDSPQLTVGGVSSRPVIGRFALSEGPSGVMNNPSDDNGPLGRTATIAVVPTGDELTFHWFKGIVALNDGVTAAGSTIAGVYGPRLTISNLAASDVGQYRVQIGNAFGTVSSAFATIGIGCPADFNHDNGVDFFDYLDFVDAFSSGDSAADFNNDTSIDFFDYLDFVDAFSQSC